MESTEAKPGHIGDSNQQRLAQGLAKGLTLVRNVIDLSTANHLAVKEALGFIDLLLDQAKQQQQQDKPVEAIDGK